MTRTIPRSAVPGRDDFRNAIRAYRKTKLEASFGPGFAAFLEDIPREYRNAFKERCATAAGATSLDRIPDLVVMRDTDRDVHDPAAYSLACRWCAPLRWSA